MKSILLVGLGRFGRHMAQKFFELRHEVLAVDSDEARVNEVLPFVTSAQIGDSTNEAFVSSLGVRNFDLCVVAIGDNFQSSLETTALLKDCGARMVVSRASRDVHAKFLLRNGADQVIYAEKEMAIRTAVRYSYDNIFDYIELTPGYSIYEIPTPPAWVGRTIVQLAVRSRYHISILATKTGERIAPLPGADHELKADERLILMGSNRDVRKIL
ncbi:potassium transporter TrkA [Oscillospiraceae bacterium]|nr:potassium transporter TrkA [Oscillospiraceae bacterium]BDF74306.1 potassium transporter TrkA [Oscillospiraceae bacterium]